tara:strand:+ start:1041 stop:1673 length:633 start_codon:yes stop_codon:yes gene_type:complete
MKKSTLKKAQYLNPDKPKRRAGRPTVTENTNLTRKQELFVKTLISQDGQITKRDAAIEAGFPASSAHQRAYEMTNPAICPHVVKAIKEYRAELDRKYGIDYQRHVRDLQKIRDAAFADKNYSAAVMAEYRRGQAQGNIYINKSEIRHGTIDSMSKDEVLKALHELRGQLNPVGIVIDQVDKEDEEEIDGKRLLVSAKKSDNSIQASMEND